MGDGQQRTEFEVQVCFGAEVTGEENRIKNKKRPRNRKRIRTLFRHAKRKAFQTLTRLADGFGLKAALPANAGFTPKIGSPVLSLNNKERFSYSIKI